MKQYDDERRRASGNAVPRARRLRAPRRFTAVLVCRSASEREATVDSDGERDGEPLAATTN